MLDTLAANLGESNANPRCDEADCLSRSTTDDPRGRLCTLLAELYERQLALAPNNPYLRDHACPAVIDNQVRTFLWYRPYLPATGTVLDWGCNHAPDCVLLRASLGGRVQLHSCDFLQPGSYPVFSNYAHNEHRRLTDEVTLPYPSHCFDAVIGSGVLEHAAMDYESLKELRRVIKPDGVLIISYLPNWLSVNEWVRRVIRKRDFHRRLYRLSEIRQLLKRAGFYPIASGYHTFFWDRLVESLGLSRWPLIGRLLRQVVPVQVFGSTLCA